LAGLQSARRYGKTDRRTQIRSGRGRLPHGEFFATETAFLSVLLLFSLLSEFQGLGGLQGYRQPATLRAQVFLRGAILWRAGNKPVFPTSSSWGGIGKTQSHPRQNFGLRFPNFAEAGFPRTGGMKTTTGFSGIFMDLLRKPGLSKLEKLNCQRREG
jgi:hypothetical protein